MLEGVTGSGELWDDQYVLRGREHVSCAVAPRCGISVDQRFLSFGKLLEHGLERITGIHPQ
jgi:hypothetical protein